jgi:hypothetical protein
MPSGHDWQVDVIGHQAIRPDGGIGAPRRRANQPPIGAIVVASKNTGSRRLPRRVTWWGKSGTTTRAIRAMPALPSADLLDVHKQRGAIS